MLGGNEEEESQRITNGAVCSPASLYPSCFVVSNHPSPAHLTSGNLLINKHRLLTKWTQCYLLLSDEFCFLWRIFLNWFSSMLFYFLFLCTAKQTLHASLKCKKNHKPPSNLQNTHLQSWRESDSWKMLMFQTILLFMQMPWDAPLLYTAVSFASDSYLYVVGVCKHE